MKNKLLKSSLTLLTVALTACSFFQPTTQQNIVKPVKIAKLNLKPIVKNNPNEHIIDLNNGKKGGKITVNLNFKDGKSFETKANTSGSQARSIYEVQSYKVYLIKATAGGYPAGGDPITDAVIAPVNLNKNDASSNIISFVGLPGSGVLAYYVAVRAYTGLNATGTEIIKPNNGGTAWGGASAGIGIAVSSNGISVNDTTLVVSSTTPLTTTCNLIDAVGATLESNVTVVSGANAGALGLTNIPISIKTVAGTGTAGYNNDNIQATTSNISSANGVALDSSGNIYIADKNNNRVRKVTVGTGVITTIAGTGTASYNGDNIQATDATLNQPNGVALDSSGNIYIADLSNNRVRKVTVGTGIITTIAGTGTSGYNGDNIQATDANLLPSDIVIDSSNNLYFSDVNRIRKVTIGTGIITTIAGTGVGGYNGDNIQATSAQINSPTGISLDNVGNVYIPEFSNRRIRKVTVGTGIITTIAGTGTAGYNGDNIQATDADLNGPVGSIIDGSGNIYISDRVNTRIRKVTVATGVITTIAGTGTGGFSGDGGYATNAQLNFTGKLAIDNTTGNLYIADQSNNRIRKVF